MCHTSQRLIGDTRLPRAKGRTWCRQSAVQFRPSQPAILFVRKGLLEQGKPFAFGFSTHRSLIKIRLMQPVKLKRVSVSRGPVQQRPLERNFLGLSVRRGFVICLCFLRTVAYFNDGPTIGRMQTSRFPLRKFGIDSDCLRETFPLIWRPCRRTIPSVGF